MSPFQEQELLTLLKLQYSIEAQSCHSLPFGADTNAFVYKVNTACITYFVKIKCNHFEETYLKIIEFLRDAGIKEIIYPLTTKEGSLMYQSDRFQIIVYPFINGKNGFEQSLTKTQWIEFGRTLKKIHGLSLPTYIKSQLRKETLTAKWREQVRYWDTQMGGAPSDDVITSDFKNYFKKNSKTIHHLINSAEMLAKSISFDPSHYVLCHSDVHAGNIILSPDNSFYIIDWDDPMFAFKERDLMFIGGGVGTVWNVPIESTYFYEGYGHAPINKTILAYYRFERIVIDIAEFAQDILSSKQDREMKSLSLKYFKSLFETKGVVDIALSMEADNLI